jgi:hypothetical protein
VWPSGIDIAGECTVGEVVAPEPSHGASKSVACRQPNHIRRLREAPPMRHLRPFAALLTIAALTMACSGPPGSSSAGGSSQGGAASQPPASIGGGGGGSGPNGSVKYEITGDVTKSGELAFTLINGGISQFLSSNGGWVAYFYSQDQNTVVQINSSPASNIFNFGDGEVLIVGTADTGCTFNYTQNDASGLKGTVDCQNVLTIKSNSGEQVHTNVHATVDAHT